MAISCAAITLTREFLRNTESVKPLHIVNWMRDTYVILTSLGDSQGRGVLSPIKYK